MSITEDQLAINLTIPVRISPRGQLPQDNPAYNSLRDIENTGFSFSLMQLLHAIGCKTAALPMSESDRSIRAAGLYMQILNLQDNNLTFVGTYGSDLQTARSQELGIAFTCLIGERYFNIPWDQLGSIAGQGKRFDYRGQANGYDCIFEAKGTSNIDYQNEQIQSGLEKKVAHHERGERFDIELIVSIYLGHNNGNSRIMIADPDKSSLRELFNKGDKRYYRLKHYCRVLQFIGLPKSAYHLNKYANNYLKGQSSVKKTIINEKMEFGNLTKITINADGFVGKWYTDWLPMDSKRYKNLINKYKSEKIIHAPVKYRFFQGVREDIYKAGFEFEPFSHDLLTKPEINKYEEYNGSKVSVFPDGSILIFIKDSD